MDEEGRKSVLDMLKRISQYPDRIKSYNGYAFDSNNNFTLNDSGLEKSMDMKTEVVGLMEKLLSLNEDPRYLNQVSGRIMDDLEFITSDTGLRQQIQSLSSGVRIRARKYKVLNDSLPQKTINFVSAVTKHYGLVEDMMEYKDGLEKERKELENRHFAKSAASTEPKTAYKDRAKDFIIELMDLGSEHGFFTGSDLIGVLDNHYENFMLSGADDDLKRAMKGLRDDINLAGRDYVVKSGELTDKKVRGIVDRLKAYAG